jgi:hypothetical protein
LISHATWLCGTQSNLSAAPGLWAGIVAVLESSSWVVLMASPEAATSVWVRQEVS